MAVNETGIDLTSVIESTAEKIWNNLPAVTEGHKPKWETLNAGTKSVLREQVLGVVKYAVDPIAQAVRSKDAAELGTFEWNDDEANAFFFGNNQ